MRQGLAIICFAFGVFLFVAESAHANQRVRIPNGSGKNLRLKVLRYEGDTNGKMVVMVENLGSTRETFSSDGLYFVPEGDPESAPQRLGAAGPFTVRKSRGVNEGGSLALAPGETEVLELEVFCIDSHRSSPNSETAFALAKKGLPSALRAKMRKSNQEIYREKPGDLKAAKTKIQRNMWDIRDKDWVPLEGERKTEKSVTPHRVAPRQQDPSVP